VAILTWKIPTASSSALALVGVTLTGLGYSLVYPGFGVEALRHAPPQSRGLAACKEAVDRSDPGHNETASPNAVNLLKQ
jgi:hypothetical protein